MKTFLPILYNVTRNHPFNDKISLMYIYHVNIVCLTTNSLTYSMGVDETPLSMSIGPKQLHIHVMVS